MTKTARNQTYSTLITDRASLIEQARNTAMRYLSAALLTTYRLMSNGIVEHERKEIASTNKFLR